MAIPSSVLLRQAARMILFQDAIWRRFVEMAETDDGRLIPAYSKGQAINGSFQPISAGTLAQMGQDISQEALNLYTCAPIGQPTDNQSGDIIIYQKRKFVVIKSTDWWGEDGWRNVVLMATDMPIADAPTCQLPDEVEVVLNGAEDCSLLNSVEVKINGK